MSQLGSSAAMSHCLLCCEGRDGGVAGTGRRGRKRIGGRKGCGEGWKEGKSGKETGKRKGGMERTAGMGLQGCGRRDERQEGEGEG